MARQGKASRRASKESAMDRVKGRLREAAGGVSGNGNKKAQGRADQRRANLRDKKSRLKGLLK